MLCNFIFSPFDNVISKTEIIFAHQIIKIRMTGLKKGYFLGIIGSILYGTNPLFALPLYEMGMKAEQVLFYRYLLAIIMMAFVLRIKKESFKINRSEFQVLMIMGIIFSLSSLSLFKSYQYMAAGLATALQFVYPAMVVLIMSTLMKERISPKIIIIIFMTLFGVLMLYNSGSNKLSSTGVIFVLFSALLYAGYLVGINLSVLKDMSPYKLSFYTLAFGLAVYLVNIQASGAFMWPQPAAWIDLIALAVLPSNISLLFTAMALQLVGSTRTSILGVFEPLTAVVIGTFLFHEVMTIHILIGIATILIAVCALILTNAEKQAKPSTHLHKHSLFHLLLFKNKMKLKKP